MHIMHLRTAKRCNSSQYCQFVKNRYILNQIHIFTCWNWFNILSLQWNRKFNFDTSITTISYSVICKYSISYFIVLKKHVQEIAKMVSIVFLLRNKWWWKFLIKKKIMISAVHCTFDFQERYFLQINVNFLSLLRNVLWQKKHRFPVHFINCFVFFWYRALFLHTSYILKIVFSDNKI